MEDKRTIDEKINEILAEINDVNKSGSFCCECLSCGHKIQSNQHCRDIKCPKCGSEMRRCERPGPGR